jgi:tartrate dehydratase alpha subunit/fumarate hydratase class I-like protein
MDDHDEVASKLVSTRLPADLHQLVEEAARAELLTNASWIRRAILTAVREATKGVHRGP